MEMHWEKYGVFYDGYLGVLVVMGIQERAHLLEIRKTSWMQIHYNFEMKIHKKLE